MKKINFVFVFFLTFFLVSVVSVESKTVFLLSGGGGGNNVISGNVSYFNSYYSINQTNNITNNITVTNNILTINNITNNFTTINNITNDYFTTNNYTTIYNLSDNITLLTFNQSATTTTFGQGQMGWDTNENSISIGYPYGATLQVGKEVYKEVTNLDSVTILEGTPVSIVGVNGNREAVKITNISNPISAYAYIGLATTTILPNEKGLITLVGDVHNLNTNNFIEGMPVYINRTGGLTQTTPTAPDFFINVGTVTVKSATVGIIAVQSGIIPRMKDLSDVDGTPINVSGQILVWNQSGLVWDASSNLYDYLLVDSFDQNLNTTNDVTFNSLIVGSGGTIGTASASIGYNTQVHHESMAVGNGNTITDAYSVAFGYNNEIQDKYDLAVGRENFVYAWDSAAIGRKNSVNGSVSYAIGYNNFIEENCNDNIAIGYNNLIISDDVRFTNPAWSTIQGNDNIIDGGDYSQILGSFNYVNGISGASYALGNKNWILGVNSINLGVKTNTTASYAVTIGAKNPLDAGYITNTQDNSILLSTKSKSIRINDTGTYANNEMICTQNNALCITPNNAITLDYSNITNAKWGSSNLTISDVNSALGNATAQGLRVDNLNSTMQGYPTIFSNLQANITSVNNSAQAKASPGGCSAGQFVNQTTTSGVLCQTPSTTGSVFTELVNVTTSEILTANTAIYTNIPQLTASIPTGKTANVHCRFLAMTNLSTVGVQYQINWTNINPSYHTGTMFSGTTASLTAFTSVSAFNATSFNLTETQGGANNAIHTVTYESGVTTTNTAVMTVWIKAEATGAVTNLRGSSCEISYMN